MLQIFKRIFGDEYEREIKALSARLPAIAEHEKRFVAVTADKLQDTTEKLKQRIENGTSLDDILPEAFALVREAAKRTLNQRHYDVQMIGAMVLHHRGIAEMRTGEGKTLVATLPVYLHALVGRGAHVVTVNDYLSRRDAVWMGQIYALLGMSVGVINSNASYLYDPSHVTVQDDTTRDELGSFKVQYDFLRECTRREAYEADITYGTNSEFGFDYLRDNIEYETIRLRQREPYFALVDEIDSILIDEARTPLIISAPVARGENHYELFAGIASRLEPDKDYTVDEKLRAISLTPRGIEKAEQALKIDNLYTEGGVKYVHHLETAVRARALFHADKEYVVRDNEIVIVDEFTGRPQPGRRWSEGLHQAVEAKEGVAIKDESRTFASITYQNYFRQYEHLAGMTGTALTSREEFEKVYGLRVVPVPTNRHIARIDRDDLIFQSETGKFKAIAKKIKELYAKKQPVLVGTASIEKNELLSQFLHAEGIGHEVLNAKNHEREGEIIAQAGALGRVTIATNMAGRGVDIKLGGNPSTQDDYEKVKSLGGLFVLGTERHEARRIDNQLRGRAGRQGDPGETQFFVSMDDSLMRIFANDTIRRMMGSFGIPEDEPIRNRLITKGLERAQERIEGFHFDARKQVLSFDDVINKQRKSIYTRRRLILLGDHHAIDHELKNIIVKHPDLEAVITQKKDELGSDEFYQVVRRLMLQTIDMFWIDQLELMDYTRSSVNLRAYGQRDPLVEYRREASRLFVELATAIDAQIAELIPRLAPQAFVREENEMKAAAKEAQNSPTMKEKQKTVVVSQKIGRNDMVTITREGERKTLKYKKAQELIEKEDWRLTS